MKFGADNLFKKLRGCHEFNKKLKAKGVDVIEVDVSELKKNGGSIRCMTLEILRD